MYCTTCELEIKGNDKDTCPVCGGALSDSQEADSALDNQDRKEETGVEVTFNDSGSSTVPEPEPVSDGSGQEEVFVLKDYDPDSLNADTAATSIGGSDELPLLNEPAQGSTHNVDDLLDSIRESIATPENPEEDSVSAAEESSELDSDFSFFDSDPQDTSTSAPSDKTMEQETEISWGYDEAATAVSMPEEPERKRSPVFKIVLIVALIAVGGYYIFTLRSGDEASFDKGVADRDMPAEIYEAAASEAQTEPAPAETRVAAEPSLEAAEAVASAESPTAEGTNPTEPSVAVVPEAQVAPEVAEAVASVEPAAADVANPAEPSAAVVPEAQVAPQEAPEAVASVEPAAADVANPAEPSAVVVPEAQVEPQEAPEVAEVVVPVKPTPVTAPFFTVHVGSYQKRVSASSEVARIKAKGYDAFIERVDLGKKGTWYRVKVGRFKNRVEAEQLQKKINKGLVTDSMVVTQRTN